MSALSRVVAGSSGALYAVKLDGSLVYYRHLGWEGGTTLFANNGRETVLTRGSGPGTAWDEFNHIAASSKGSLYAVRPDGSLVYYRHLGWENGSTDFANNGQEVVLRSGGGPGTAWDAYVHVLAGENGSLYGILADGSLHYYRHLGFEDGSINWANGGNAVILRSGEGPGTAWDAFDQVAVGDDGALYGIENDDTLVFYRHYQLHNGESRLYSSSRTVLAPGRAHRTDWGRFVHIFAGSGGTLYGINPDGSLHYYRHLGWRDGTREFTNNREGVLLMPGDGESTAWDGFRRRPRNLSEYAHSIRSAAGLPLESPILNPDGVGRRQRHQNGYVYGHSGRGSYGFIPRGAIWQMWSRGMWEQGALGYPNNGNDVTPSWTTVPFEGGTITADPGADVSFYFLNTQLIDPGYKGRGRSEQVRRIIEILENAASSTDVVGLAELFDNSERKRVRKELEFHYPFALEGPSERGVQEDGGLLLLSKHPFIQTGKLIYRPAAGWDWWADKGILHARIALDGLRGRPIDVFVSHLQAGHAPEREAQGRIFASYVAGLSQRDVPAIAMADYNMDFNAPDAWRYASILGHPVDAWRANGWGETPPGITSDRENRYRTGKSALPMNSARRHVNGTRIDAAMIYPADDATLVVDDAKVIADELRPRSGVDVSDHYGVRVEATRTPVTVRFSRRITSVAVWVSRVHCMDTTSGPSEDEVYFMFYAGTEERHMRQYKQKIHIGGMSDGEIRTLRRPRDPAVIEIPRGVSRILTRVLMKENDTFSRDETIGDKKAYWSEEQLLLSDQPNLRHELPMPLMTGESSRYTVYLAYDIETT